MKNICLVTGSRAEYGIMRELIKKLYNDADINLDIIATAMHLEEKYGETYKEIETDGFSIFRKIPMNLIDTSNQTILNGIAHLTKALGKIFSEKKYDLTIILGDRYEMLAVANTSIIYNVPICHLHGGEITLGNYDEFIRHAITKMSHIHLASTEPYRKRIIQLGEHPDTVYNIGAMGVENVLKTKLLSKSALATELGITLEENYNVILFHPVTIENTQPIRQVEKLLAALKEVDRQYVFIGSNSDTGSDHIMDKIRNFVGENTRHHLFSSVPTLLYHSLVKNSKGLIGNSSSGLIEIPSLNVATLNIGDRQKGRISGTSVINVPCESTSIIEGIRRMEQVTTFENPYQKDNSVETAYNIIKEALKNKIIKQKIFYDIECH